MTFLFDGLPPRTFMMKEERVTGKREANRGLTVFRDKVVFMD